MNRDGVFGLWRWCVPLVAVLGLLGCDLDIVSLSLVDAADDPHELKRVIRIAHMSDTHLVDEQSPARFTEIDLVEPCAWRPHESYAAQLLDGVVRSINGIHAGGRQVDLLLHTGDACDNAQGNELQWFITVMDGGVVDPLTGPDDRPNWLRPPPSLDPHAPFVAQGVYQRGVHGQAASIPWYMVFGNHDAFAVGVLPIIDWYTRRVAPLPLADNRPGIVLPIVLDPVGSLAYGHMTPAHPGPPWPLNRPSYVQPNADRAFFDKPTLVEAMLNSQTDPTGHGFGASAGMKTWYSVSPVPGLRLIGLDTTDAVAPIPGLLYHQGAISATQGQFLRNELASAARRGELVVIASHHPSGYLSILQGSSLTGPTLRGLLGSYPNVVLHLAGHSHSNRVTDHGSYVEIETGSTLDLPQEARLVEIWRDQADDSVLITYEMVSHLDDTAAVVGDDPLRALRARAMDLALADDDASAASSAPPADRVGAVRLAP